ncbi:ComF family protein [bacterium Scap17]|nr:ComF family protein [bacterium Scap17]
MSQQPCARCLSSPPAFARCFAPLRYEGLLAGLFQRYKDQHQRRAGRLLRQLMQREFTHFCRDWLQAHPCGAVLLVPADAYRRRQRGHDALAELCRGLTPVIAGHQRDMARVRDRRMPHEASVAVARAAPDQRLRDRRGRLKAQRGRYDIDGLLPEHVLLIDDVMTSGATLDSLAQACLRAGAREVDACVLARTPLSTRGVL